MASFGIGAKLRQERLTLCRSLDDVARETRISEKFLDAIEREDFERLPGLLFTRNFVRQYAQSLKLDPDPLLAELPRPDQSAVRLPDAPVPVPYSGERPIGSFVWFALAAAGILGAWYLSHSVRARPGSSPSPVASVQPAPSASAPARATDALAQPQATQSADATQSPDAGQALDAKAAPDTTPAPGDNTPRTAQVTAQTPSPTISQTPSQAISQTPSQARAQTASQPTSQPTSQPAGAPDARAAAALPVRVVLKAQEPSWIQMSVDGKVAFTGTLQPNDTKEISANERVKIVTGNAGGLTISLNGKMLDPLGPSGQVRTVMLTAEGPQFPAKALPSEPDQL